MITPKPEEDKHKNSVRDWYDDWAFSGPHIGDAFNGEWTDQVERNEDFLYQYKYNPELAKKDSTGFFKLLENVDHVEPVFDRNAQVAKFGKKFTEEEIPWKFREALSVGEVGVGKTEREWKLPSEPENVSLGDVYKGDQA